MKLKYVVVRFDTDEQSWPNCKKDVSSHEYLEEALSSMPVNQPHKYGVYLYFVEVRGVS